MQIPRVPRQPCPVGLRWAIRRLAWGVLVLGVLSGCSTLQTAGGPAVPVAAEAAATTVQPSRWWYLRFRFDGPRNGEVDSYLDALVADQVLSAAIAQYQPDIGLWRFHRRWAADEAGHQFSLIFYAPPPLAQRLIAQVERDPLVGRLTEQGYLSALQVDQAAAGRATDPAATSDPGWSPEIQREWPKFIMGASRMWLGLVQAEAAKHPDLEIHARYRAVEEALDELWFAQGNHAFFHHLSALFGYKPVRILRQETMTF